MDPRARVDTSGQGQAATSAREVVASFRAGDDGLLGVLLCTELPQHFPSKGFAKRTLARKQCLVDGSVVTEMKASITQGQLVEYVLSDKVRVHSARTGPPPSLELEWAYVDQHLAVCVKPTGIAVQGDETANLLTHAVGWALPPVADRPDAFAAARPVHRIDKGTGGLLVYARTNSAAVLLNQAFAARTVRKTYIALVCGKLEGEGHVELPIRGKPARSEWMALSSVKSAASGWLTTVRLHPETGMCMPACTPHLHAPPACPTYMPHLHAHPHAHLHVPPACPSAYPPAYSPSYPPAYPPACLPAYSPACQCRCIGDRSFPPATSPHGSPRLPNAG